MIDARRPTRDLCFCGLKRARGRGCRCRDGTWKHPGNGVQIGVSRRLLFGKKKGKKSKAKCVEKRLEEPRDSEGISDTARNGAGKHPELGRVKGAPRTSARPETRAKQASACAAGRDGAWKTRRPPPQPAREAHRNTQRDAQSAHASTAGSKSSKEVPRRQLYQKRKKKIPGVPAPAPIQTAAFRSVPFLDRDTTAPHVSAHAAARWVPAQLNPVRSRGMPASRTSATRGVNAE